MAERSDPYFLLLALPPGTRPPNHYELLGLAPGDDDAAHVAAAADRQMERLAPFVAGEHARDAQRLLGEVAVARATLVNPTARAAYDAQLAAAAERAVQVAKSNSPPVLVAKAVSAVDPLETNDAIVMPKLVAPPKSVFVGTAVGGRTDGNSVAHAPLVATTIPTPVHAINDLPPAVDDDLDFDTAMLPPPGNARWSDTPEEQAALAAGLPSSLSLRSPSKTRRKTSPAVIVGTLGIVCLISVGAAGYVVSQGGWRLSLASSNPSADRDEKPAKPPQRDLADLVKPAEVRGGDSTAASADPVPPAIGTVNLPISDQTITDTKRFMKPVDPPAVTPSDDPASTAGAKPVESEKPLVTDNPAPESMPTVAPKASQEQVEAVRSALDAARNALAERDLAKSSEHLDLAELEAATPDLAAQVDEARLLRHYVEGFWNAVRESAKSLAGGEEFNVNGKTVIVVEGGAEQIVIRSAGENRTFKILELPPLMATTLAERWLAKDDANSQAFVGAFWSVDPKIEPAQARGVLRKAAEAGAADAPRLERLLDAAR